MFNKRAKHQNIKEILIRRVQYNFETKTWITKSSANQYYLSSENILLDFQGSCTIFAIFYKRQKLSQLSGVS